MELWLGAGLVAFVSFTAVALMSAAKEKPPEDPTKPKFVATTAGCMGCLMAISMAISVVIGVLASIVSLAASVKKFME